MFWKSTTRVSQKSPLKMKSIQLPKQLSSEVKKVHLQRYALIAGQFCLLSKYQWLVAERNFIIKGERTYISISCTIHAVGQLS